MNGNNKYEGSDYSEDSISDDDIKSSLSGDNLKNGNILPKHLQSYSNWNIKTFNGKIFAVCMGSDGNNIYLPLDSLVKVLRIIISDREAGVVAETLYRFKNHNYKDVYKELSIRSGKFKEDSVSCQYLYVVFKLNKAVIYQTTYDKNGTKGKLLDSYYIFLSLQEDLLDPFGRII